MEIRQLKYFVAACKYLNFSKAAEACFVSAQGMSIAIQRLESELGAELFVRTKGGLQLTAAGKYLLPQANRLIDISGECECYFASGSRYTDSVSVAVAPGTIEEYVGDIFEGFQEEAPDIRIHVREYFDTFCEAAVSNGAAELGFTCGKVSSKVFDARLAAKSRYALIVHESHPLAQKESVSVNELRNLPVSVLRDTTKTYPVIRSACQKEGFEPIISTFVDNILTVYDLAQIRQTAGISTMALFGHLNRPRLRAVPFEEEDLDWEVYYIRRKGAALSPAAQKLEDYVLKDLESGGDST